MKKYRIFAILCVVVFGQNSFAQDYENGLDEFRRGDYKAALDDWLPAAEKGDALAQYSIGFLFDKGAGVPLDDAEAERWYRRAVERGNLEADFALASMYASKEIVAYDSDEMYHWVSLNASVAFREIDKNNHLPSIHAENTEAAIELFHRIYAEEAEEYDRAYQTYKELFGIFFAVEADTVRFLIEERCNVEIECHLKALRILRNIYTEKINETAVRIENLPSEINEETDNETFGYRDFLIGENIADAVKKNCEAKLASNFGWRCYGEADGVFVFFDENGELEDLSGGGTVAAEIASSAAVDFQGNIGVMIVKVPPKDLTRIQIHMYPVDSDVLSLYSKINDLFSNDYQLDWQYTDRDVAMFDSNSLKRLDKSFKNGQVALTLYREIYDCRDSLCIMVEYRNPKLAAQWADQNHP